MFVVLNFTEHKVPFHMPEGLNAGGAALLIDNYKGDAALEDRMMRPYEAAVSGCEGSGLCPVSVRGNQPWNPSGSVYRPDGGRAGGQDLLR